MTSNGGSNQGDPSELFAKGLSFFSEAAKLFGKEASDELKDVQQRAREFLQSERPFESAQRARKEPSPVEQRENLAFGLAERAVTALEDIALNTAAIRQRLGGADVLNPVNKPAPRPDLGTGPLG